MKFSSGAVATFSVADGIRFDQVLPGLGLGRSSNPLRILGRPLRRGLGMRGPAHALLADAHGAWAWAPGDCYAAATRYGGVRDWMRTHAGSDMRLWVSGDLMHSLDDIASLPAAVDGLLDTHVRRELVARHGDAAAAWPLAGWQDSAFQGVVALSGVDLDTLRGHGLLHRVRILSVMPWWHHAFVEARRCVPKLDRAAAARVCVVEGRQVMWITTARGAMSQLRRATLHEATVDALRAEMAGQARDESITVVLGQGLADGGKTGRIEAFVLGRLDGEQPPQWLRPCSRPEMH